MINRAVIYGDTWLTSLPKECSHHAWTLWDISEWNHAFFKTKREITMGKPLKDHPRVLLGLQTSSHLTIQRCSLGTMLVLSWAVMMAGCSLTTSCTIKLTGQLQASPLQVMWLQRQTRKAMNKPMRKPKSCSNHNVLGLLQVALHVRPTAASLLSVAGEGT